MKRNERMILVGFVVLGLMVAFYLLVLTPKQHEASQLQTQVDDLKSSLSQAQQEATAAESARRSFGIDYRRLVVLGKAVPADSDQTSLLVQLQHLADESGVQFNAFDLSDASTSAAPSTATSTSTSSPGTSTSTDSSSTTSTTSSSTTTASAVPSEAAVSTLPIGASVGPAGLPVMPYTLGFKGGFSQIADFMQRLDSMVGMKGNLVDVKGRLLTVDGFKLTAAPPGSPDAGTLTAELDVTSFVTPADQGITGGASPTGPAAATPTPASNSTTTPGSTGTSTSHDVHREPDRVGGPHQHIAMNNVRPPQFLANVYRDLRDRRLLLPVVLLAVALVAVPVLLKSHAKTSTMPATSTTVKASDTAAVPAVVTQKLGVTNYRKRLNQLQSKDPFHAPPSADAVTNRVKNASITDANIPSTSSTGSNSTSSSSTSTTLSTPSTSSTTPATGGTSATSSPSVSSTPPSSGGSTPQPPTKPTFHLYTYRVAVKVGEPGKLSDRPEVSSLALLPSKSRPILSFLEANGKQALFLVSSDVDSVKGDGRCVPKPASCQYIIMRAGDKASFHYAPGNKRFNLVLKDIHAVEIGHKPPTKTSKASGDVNLKPKLPLLGQG